MTPTTPRPTLLRLGAAKTLTRSLEDGTIKEAGSSQYYFV
ncbi:hypothetical protein EIB18_14385 [Caulobacter vibrioides]|uniref:Uncharacterized protein n=2 Tax=Caulobacter vibrioides TaxID=155892 RepID=Q9A4W2_CAUVC|nr:hypothetical protein [Caulobacter vibrioides]YP_002518170.1 hypothetical protein CCNA_02797 [Caulobacter vibrioides NA1000]AAK24678.1 hypothetical protein CC_2713 [Caulobacter vibrioides CB15]ACL96262.1 hypothetical protein CCNA_02797 [Caulobacter vibrioides NA1000]ATC29550.1 hypothetical protein CA607_14660 [Caulobacter vibrioides]AZH13781.1 hypothetical protein EIB18_14385 [Caulobacter vibrioides]QXZ51069.1 hypothetical protein KZH45_14415 [Caulobacter vibrioides]